MLNLAVGVLGLLVFGWLRFFFCFVLGFFVWCLVLAFFVCLFALVLFAWVFFVFLGFVTKLATSQSFGTFSIFQEQ